MDKNKERIVIIPKEQLAKVPKELKAEFDQIIDRLQQGEDLGEPMDLEPCKDQLVCVKCGSQEVSWVLDKNSKEVMFRCKACKYSYSMTEQEYLEAVELNLDCVIK